MDSLQPRSTIKFSQNADSRRSHSRNKKKQQRKQNRFLTILISIFMLILGIGIGIGGLLLYAFFGANAGRSLITPLPPNGGDIVIQVGPAYMSHLIELDLKNSGLPGQISNVQVTLVHGDEMTISGDDQLSLLGVSTTRQVTVNVQPITRNCQLQIHVISVDLQGIPVTSFVSSFESQVNQQLQLKTTDLPAGFTYCAVYASTETRGLFVTYSAKPT